MTANESQYFMRPEGANGLDAAAFHYSVYRSLTRFLGMDGNLEVPYDVPRNWAQMWNVIFTSSGFSFGSDAWSKLHELTGPLCRRLSQCCNRTRRPPASLGHDESGRFPLALAHQRHRAALVGPAGN